MKVILIAAMAKNRAIGVRGDLPWKLPEDMKRFRELTRGHPIVMGRKSFESLGRKGLPGRTSLVLTRHGQSEALKPRPEGSHPAEFFETLDLALLRAKELNPVIYVTGGSEIYSLAMSIADEIDLTEIDWTPKESDAFFPEIPEKNFRFQAEPWQTSEQSMPPGLRFRFSRYTRE